MKMIAYTVGTVVAVIFVIAWCNDGHAQVINKPPPNTVYGGSSSSSSSSSSTIGGGKTESQSKTERCIKDAFGNFTCTESGTRIITDSNGNITVIPFRR